MQSVLTNFITKGGNVEVANIFTTVYKTKIKYITALSSFVTFLLSTMSCHLDLIFNEAPALQLPRFTIYFALHCVNHQTHL